MYIGRVFVPVKVVVLLLNSFRVYLPVAVNDSVGHRPATNPIP